MNGAQGFLDGGGDEEGGAEGTVFTNALGGNEEGGAEGIVFMITMDVGMRGGGGGREMAEVGSAMRGHVLILGIFGKIYNV